MKLTNRNIKTLYYGFSALTVRVENKEVHQRELPLMPSIRTKRMKDDLEDLFKSIEEVEKNLDEKLEGYVESLSEQVKDEGDGYDKEDMEVDVEAKQKTLQKELDELLDETVEVTFSDPLTKADIERLDKEAGNLPYQVGLAMEILLTKDKDKK